MSGIVVPSSFRSVAGSGEPVHVYRQRRQSKGCGLIVLIALLFLALGTGYCSFTAFMDVLSGSQDHSILLVFGLASLFVLPGAVFWAWWTLSRWNETAVVYQDGLAYYNGRRMHTVRWNEVESLLTNVVQNYLYFIPGGTDHMYTITTQTGDRFKLGSNSLSSIEELTKHVRREVFPHLLARARETFEAGAPVHFGPFSISKAQGVQKGSKSYPWNDIAEIAMSHGWVWVIPQTDRLLSSVGAPVSKIPNGYRPVHIDSGKVIIKLISTFFLYQLLIYFNSFVVKFQ